MKSFTYILFAVCVATSVLAAPADVEPSLARKSHHQVKDAVHTKIASVHSKIHKIKPSKSPKAVHVKPTKTPKAAHVKPTKTPKAVHVKPTSTPIPKGPSTPVTNTPIPKAPSTKLPKGTGTTDVPQPAFTFAPDVPTSTLPAAAATAIANAGADHVKGDPMLGLTFGQTLFDKIGDLLETAIPAQFNSMFIGDIVGTLPPLIKIPGMTGDTAYKFTNIKFQNVSVAADSRIGIMTDYAAVDVHGMNIAIVADYAVSTQAFFTRKEAKGQMKFGITGGSVTGAVGIHNNGKGGIEIWMSNTVSNMEDMTIHIADSWWMTWMQNFAAKVAQPIISSAIGGVIQTAIPPLINTIFENTFSLNLVTGNGYKLGFHTEVHGEPKLTPGCVFVGVDLVAARA